MIEMVVGIGDFAGVGCVNENLLSAVAPDLLPQWRKVTTSIDQLRPAQSLPK
jgi:hypothetical protein